MLWEQGLPGLAAAIEAATAGASVLVLEKMKAAGGNSIISDGGMAVAESPLQKRHGIEDSADLFLPGYDESRPWTESSGTGQNTDRPCRGSLPLADRGSRCGVYGQGGFIRGDIR